VTPELNPELNPEQRELLARFSAGETLALSRTISLVENQLPGFEALLHALHDRLGGARRIGITGPPGAGKSTLTAGLARRFRDAGEKVGVIAVDPSSPFTGGALLGDRIRMNALATEPGIFIRSMASRGSHGGLSATTREATDLLDAFGFGRILLETVGVGQSELEIASQADTTVLVLVPESGDGIQAMKAGLMEVADLFVVNKADRPGADRLRSEIRVVSHLKQGVATSLERPDTAAAWDPPILMTVASTGEGIDELAEELDRHHAYLASGEGLARRRRAAALDHTRMVLERAVGRRVAEAWAREVAGALDPLNEDESPYEVARRIAARLCPPHPDVPPS
jgi:LAO/AO transport system kinase